jgi:hypothetical protein
LLITLDSPLFAVATTRFYLETMVSGYFETVLENPTFGSDFLVLGGGASPEPLVDEV